MLKPRITAALIVRDSIVVQSEQFKNYLPVGKPEIATEFLNDWGVDEIILLDISATRDSKEPNFSMVRKVSHHCRVPLMIGGGIDSVTQIHELMRCGADKVCLNNISRVNPEFIMKVATIFGSQCICVSIDAKLIEGNYKVYDYLSDKVIDKPPQILAREMQDLGAGEILINSVDHDGGYQGYDLELIDTVCKALSIPVICCGGAGSAAHFIEALNKTNVSAVAAANIFHFTEHSVITTKSLIQRELKLRIETHATYEKNDFDNQGRLLKKDEDTLSDMAYIKIEKEVI